MSTWLFIWPASVAGTFLLAATWLRPEQRLARLVLLTVTGVTTVRYAAWRWTDTLPTFHFGFECFALYAFFALEALSIFLFLRGRRVLGSSIIRSAQADRGEHWLDGMSRPPLVDVFVPTYNEKWEVLEKTFAGLRALQYARFRVWILDDGKRDWLEREAAERGFNYLRRSSGAHYKAGNLNNALRRVISSGEKPEFIASFDADFVPQPNFLRRTVALMADERVGLVQTPQSFYNPDPFQYGFRAERTWPDEQRFLFEVKMPSADAQNGAQCSGTSFLIRMKSLDDIGGHFPIESICEDTLTSMKLRRAGWRTVYLAERLSVGLNPEGLSEFLKQRSRWCLGGVEIARWSLSTANGVGQTLLGLEGMLKWGYMSFMQMLWLCLPVLYWLTGFSLLNARAGEVVAYMVPMWLGRSYLAWVTRGTQMPVITDSMTLAMAPTVVRATWSAVFPRHRQTFEVTNKGVSRGHVIVHSRTVACACAALCLLVGGMLLRTFAFPLNVTSSASAWHYCATLQQSLVLLAVMLVAVERPRRRTEERYPLSESVSIDLGGRTMGATACDLSVTGARIRCDARLGPGDSITIEVGGVGPLPATVVRRASAGEYGVRFQTGDLREKLIQRIYCTPLVFPKRSWSALPSLLSIFRRLGEVLGLLVEQAQRALDRPRGRAAAAE